MSARKSIGMTRTSETTRTKTSILVRNHSEEEEEEEHQQAQPLQGHTPDAGTSTTGINILEVSSSPPRGPITATTTTTATTTPPSAASPNLGGSTHNNLSNTTQCNTQVIEDTSLTAACYCDYYDDELALQQSNNSLLRTIPWGRITNTSSTATKHWDLIPRPSNDTFPSATATTATTSTSTSTPFMGLHLLTGQIFNEYTLGRSLKADLPIEPLPPAPSSQQESVSSIITSKVHSMISNRHAKIYCLFLGNHHNMEVYIEDTSGNGTFINSTVKLRKGEKRLLHSGDTIGFVNPQIVYGLIHTTAATTTTTTTTTTTNVITTQWKQQLHRDIVQHYAFHYVQLYTAAAAATTTITTNPASTAMQPPPNRFSPSSLSPPLDTVPPSTPMAEKSISHTHISNSSHHTNQNNTTSSKKKKKNNFGEGIVNVKALHSPSQQLQKPTSGSQALLDSPKKLAFHGIPTNTATTNNKPNHVDNTSKHYQDMMMVFPLPMKRKLQHQQQQQQQQSTSLTFEQQYDLREILGSGTCGQVRRAIHRNSGKVVAVKIIPLKKKMPKKKRTDLLERQMQPSKSDTTTTTTSTTAEQEAIQAEATLLQSLSHPYIVQMYDLHVDQRYVYIVMELVEGGDLLDRIVSHGCYSERGARQIMRRLLSALVYLHSQRIVHRDLKPENILVPPLLISAVKGASKSQATTITTSNTMVIKITDFGLAKQLTEDGLAKTFCGTPQYFAPEVLQRQNTITAGWYGGPAADCWSLGVILYILLSGYQPFDYSINPNHLITCGSWEIDFSDPVWHPISRSAKDLITRLLCTDATKRITAKEACTHEWILIQDGDTHTHPLDDPLLATHHHHPSNQNQRQEQKNSSIKDIEEQNEQSRNNTVNVFSSSTPADALTKTHISCAYKNHAPDAVTEDHHDGAIEVDDELLSDFSDDDNVDTIGRNDIVESDRNIIKSQRKAFFWRPDKLKARNSDEHVGEEQNIEH